MVDYIGFNYFGCSYIGYILAALLLVRILVPKYMSVHPFWSECLD